MEENAGESSHKRKRDLKQENDAENTMDGASEQ